MPDKNKLEAMAVVGYKIAECCATCRYAMGQSGWGSCFWSGGDYQHSKHGSRHLLPAHRMLRCSQWELSNDLRVYLGNYASEP